MGMLYLKIFKGIKDNFILKLLKKMFYIIFIYLKISLIHLKISKIQMHEDIFI